MATTMKPLLAATIEDVNALKFPVFASPKLDGVRAIVDNGRLLSRSLKPFPNPHVNKLYGLRGLSGYDGELIIGKPNDKDVFRNTSGALQRDDGEPKVDYYVFDRWDVTATYKERRKLLRATKNIVIVPQTLVKTAKDLLAYEESALEEGYEGVMVRDPEAQYKFGRSTLKAQTLLKLKRFVDSEAEIIEVEEELHNANEAKKNALGRTERSSHKAGMVPTGRMGALKVRDVKTGVEFHIGTGFTAEDREADWLPGMIVKYKSFPVGTKDKPRFPVFLGRRMKEDM